MRAYSLFRMVIHWWKPGSWNVVGDHHQGYRQHVKRTTTTTRVLSLFCLFLSLLASSKHYILFCLRCQVNVDYTEKTVSISNYPLSAALTCAKMCSAFEEVWGVLWGMEDPHPEQQQQPPVLPSRDDRPATRNTFINVEATCCMECTVESTF